MDNENQQNENRRLAKVVEQRVGHGPTPIVSGWQMMLQDMLEKMNRYLKSGSIVTFQKLTPQETDFFSLLANKITVPHTAVAIFLPPSVRQQMLGGWSGDNKGVGPPDAGVMVASWADNYSVILNALFAYPPFTPAVDIYDQGQFSAGYQYDNIEACRSELSELLNRHLGSDPAKQVQ